jgi:triosephosphate isomerase
MSAKRRFFVGGNWKCNGTRELITNLVRELNAGRIPDPHVVEVVVSPPFLYLDFVSNIIRSEIAVAAQNCWAEAQGAYTGEVSPVMLLDSGIEWVILGHSERRQLFGESNELIAKKVGLASQLGMKVILCIGEKLSEREANLTQQVLVEQLKPCLSQIKDWSKIVIAYEPVWAIGTDKVATPAQAQEAHSFVREWLATNASNEAASCRIIYGGLFCLLLMTS